MSGEVLDWHGDLDRWLEPFLTSLGHKARRRMFPLYIAGLIGPGSHDGARLLAHKSAHNLGPAAPGMS